MAVAGQRDGISMSLRTSLFLRSASHLSLALAAFGRLAATVMK